MAKKISDDEINTRLSTNRNSEYELAYEHDKGVKQKAYIRHINCGNIWHVVPYDVIRGVSTCPKCAVAKRRTFEEATEYLHEKTQGRYTLISDYKGVKSKATIMHNECGIVMHTIIFDVAEGKSRCPKCTKVSSGFDPNKKAFLYFMHFTSDSQPVFKLGITNRTPELRHSLDIHLLESVWNIEVSKGIVALKAEKYLLSKYHKFKLPLKALHSGYTEFLSCFIEKSEAIEYCNSVQYLGE